ncbi:MAG: hypothetical protein B6U75_00950 [Desulfurococcales archaeon ex4484_217_1]|nr:MAG: hypothetical protein B6U75_00950 [Desulfurococcales archaeon ex4484_217_1]
MRIRLLIARYITLIGGIRIKSKRQNFIITAPAPMFNIEIANVSSIIERNPYINVLTNLL